MIRQVALHRLVPWLIGLFFIAQICGVVQLLSEHTAHVTESQLILSEAAVTGNTSHGHHHHHDGDADGAIQHHELQDLNGAPACLIASCELAFTHDTITAYVSDAFTESKPVLLERPPKPFLSV
jgi:hypothetical protein